VETLRRTSIRVTGRVQGVFFRRETQREARKLGLAGFVKNERDGTVTAEAEGPEKAVGALIRWCRSGPENARVETVVFTEIEPRGDREFIVKD
jgi:acylphosphatase